MLKISVAMTTYNGEKYIIQQIESILVQTRQPDEVIICDDGSTDSTPEIIEKFIKDNGLGSKWKLILNQENKGYNKNFIDCAQMTTGDIIFFCDQDDIWHREKIEHMVNAFMNNSDMRAISCRLSVINSSNQSNNEIINRLRMGNGNLEKIKFSKQVKNNMSGGLTLAVNRELLQLISSVIVKENLPYDLSMGLFAALTDSYYILWEPLVYYRVHDNNVSQPLYSLKGRLLNPEYHIRGRKLRLELMRACSIHFNDKLKPRDRAHLADAIKVLESDVINLRKRRTIFLFRGLFSFNPMINKQISLFNIILSLFGSYVNSNTERIGEIQ